MLHPDLLAILRCPKCRGTLTERSAPPSLLCASCHLVYAVEDGRLSLARVEDALKRQRRAKERFLPRTLPERPATLRTLRQTLGQDAHLVIADEMARFA